MVFPAAPIPVKKSGIGRRSLFFGIVLLLSVASAARGGEPKEEASRRIKRVYDAVARSFGDGRLPPRLQVIPSEEDKGSPARTENAAEVVGELTHQVGSRKEVSVIISDRVMTVLAPLGEKLDDGLAFLLGHELAHFYLRHGWVGHFGNSNMTLEIGRTMNRTAFMEEIAKLETEADYFGGFYGHLAGYDALEVAPRVIDLIYSAYRFPEKMPNYPSRVERKLIAENGAKNLRKLVPVFEAANRLVLTEQYEEAARLYESVVRTFPSRELHNNAGVAYALAGLRLFGSEAPPFALPFELDAETRLKAAGSKTRSVPTGTDAARRRALLEKAADAFDAAIQRDRNYGPAYVNLAAVNSLLGDNDSALLLTNRAMELARQNNDNAVLADALVIRGILYASGGNRPRALVDLAAARNYGAPYADVNLAVVREEPRIPIRKGQEKRTMLRESIGGRTPETVPAGKGQEETFTLEGIDKHEPTITVRSLTGDGWESERIAVGRKTLTIVATPRDYGGQSARGIRRGASEEDVRKAYGEPTRIVAAPQGHHAVYADTGIVFTFAPGKGLTDWLIYESR